MEMIADIEAEKRVLSSMLHSEMACIEAFSAIVDDDFFRPNHRDIFLLANSLYVRGVIPTYVEVIKEGHILGFFKNVSNSEEVHHIAEQHINDKNIKYWLARVKNASKGRQVQQLLMQYQEEIQREATDIPGLISKAGTDFLTLSLDSGTDIIETAESISALGKKAIIENSEKWRKLQEEYKFGDSVPLPLEGVPTGLSRLDGFTLGYKPGDLIILGAQTGHGKTAFALNTAMAICVYGKKPLLYVNTEMSRMQIANRLGAILAQIPLQKIRNGSLSDAELTQVKSAFGVLEKCGFYASHIPNLTPYKLQTLARKAKLQYNIEILILDYVGRMEKIDRKLQEWQVLEDIVKSCKILAQNLNIACMVLVQLNEDGSLQGAKRMKNECDLMLKLIPVDHDQMEQIRSLHKRQYEDFSHRLFIDKSRDSIAGVDIPIVFDKQRQQIRQAQVIGGK